MQKKLLMANIIAVILGITLNRYVSDKYGHNGTVVAMSVVVGIMISAYLCLIFMKQYYAVLGISSFVLPILIMFIGVLINNDYILVTGLLLLLILIPITIVIVKKSRNN
ncbi:MAG: hypothetical protein LIR50_12360 [Bacillota bacterium]|nr:hypothetical protein [Bacillota bacterium]